MEELLEAARVVHALHPDAGYGFWKRGVEVLVARTLEPTEAATLYDWAIGRTDSNVVAMPERPL